MKRLFFLEKTSSYNTSLQSIIGLNKPNIKQKSPQLLNHNGQHIISVKKIYPPLLLILFLLLSGNVYSQSQPQHKKKMYLSPEGKLYFNKQVPVYFWISDSPDEKSKHYRLKSETTPQYSNPMYFDTEGRNTLRSPSAVDTTTKQVIFPERDIEFQIYADGIAPVTEIIFDGNNLNRFKGILYVPNNLNVSLSAKDELSGVDKIMLSVDGSPYNEYKPMTLDQEKYYQLKYYAYDNTGNVENIKKVTFRVDKTAPVSNLKIEGNQYKDILSGNTLIDIVSIDTISGVNKVYYCIDDTIFKVYKGKINTALLAQGEHKLKYYATDMVNNQENVQTKEFYIDNTPPQVIEEIQGKTFAANGREFSAGTSRLKISSFDNKSGVNEIYYSINNAPYIKYDKPIVLSGYKGNLVVTSYAVDNVGNKSESNLSNSRKNSLSYVDLGAPWVGHSFSGPQFFSRDTLFISQKTSIILEAKDAESGVQKIEYQIDSTNLQLYSKPFNLNHEGIHRIFVYGYDNTDNLTRQDFAFVIDTTGPDIYERYSTISLGIIESQDAKHNLYPSHTVVFLSATDVLSGYESLLYSLNNGPWQPYLRDIRGFIPKSKNTIIVKAIDKLGNSTFKTIEFHIK